MNGPRIGGLFEGYGGLSEAVRSALGGELAWCSEIEPAACRVLEHHYPGVTNFGDITHVDWATVPPVDVLTGGFPCQDISSTGQGGTWANRTEVLWSNRLIGVQASLFDGGAA